MTKVFVHGVPETDAIWAPLVAALADGGIDDIALLSPPGFGAPTPAGWDAHPNSYVAWLAEQLEQLDGPIDIVGHDWGAGHVLGLVAARPDLVRSWVVDCGGLADPDYVWHDGAQAWQSADGEAVIEVMGALPTEERAAAYEGAGLTPAAAASCAAAFDAEMGRCILALYRAAVQPFMADLGRRVANSSVPGMFLTAVDDPYVSADLASQAAASIGVGEVRLEGRGHWWMMDHLDPITAALTSFWETPQG